VILVEIRTSGHHAETAVLHPRVTVLGGLEAARRRAWADALAAVLRGEDASAEVDVQVDIDGRRERLTPELVRRLGLSDPGVSIFAGDLPGARLTTPSDADDSKDAGAALDAGDTPDSADAGDAPSPNGDAAPSVATLRAEVAGAETALAGARRALAEAERAAVNDADSGDGATLIDPAEIEQRAGVLEGVLEAARTAAAAARQNLAAAEEAERLAADARNAGDEVERAERDRRREALAALEAERTELVGRMVEAGDPGDPAPVERALDGLRRLQLVKPKPSTTALRLAQRWDDVIERLAGLPQPPQPPEWLVAPALAALHEAREALVEAEGGSSVAAVDPDKIATLERVHGEVLDAEQKAMRKGSRINRRRLDQAHEQEAGALAALGVNSYGEYLQRIAPRADGTSSANDRVQKARAALADAEAVWEELHGGQASPEWTAVKEEQAEVRADAHALLGREVDDAQLSELLRSHLETVVDTGWAEQALVDAMTGVGAGVADGEDLQGAAERWLAESPAKREARAALQGELQSLDVKIESAEAAIAEVVVEQDNADQSDAPAEPSALDPELAALRRAATEAAEAERKAEAELSAARAHLESARAVAERQAEASLGAQVRRAAVDSAQAEVVAAEERLAGIRAAAEAAEHTAERAAAAEEAARLRAADAERIAAARDDDGVDLSSVVAMEAELFVLARVAALRSAPGGPLPLVFDARAALAGLPGPAAARMLGLLERTSATVQVVVLGEDGSVGEWARTLGDSAAVRAAVR